MYRVSLSSKVSEGVQVQGFINFHSFGGGKGSGFHYLPQFWRGYVNRQVEGVFIFYIIDGPQVRGFVIFHSFAGGPCTGFQCLPHLRRGKGTGFHYLLPHFRRGHMYRVSLSSTVLEGVKVQDNII